MLFIERCEDAAGSEKKRLNVPLLSIRDLSIDFKSDVGAFRAVDGLSFDVPKGKTVALVGESGSGKSVTAQAILRILPKVARIGGGSILFDDPANDEPPLDIATLDPEGETVRALRGGRIAMIFQEPMTSLSPLHTVGDQVSEALLLHGNVGKAEALDRAVDVFARVGFPDPKRALVTYPFELSGGLRQRAMIAMALITRPALLIADEPTTALDVTTQAQILDLMRELQGEAQMSLLLITHDLGVVANMADHVVVMYRGRVVEAGSREDLFRRAQHPYLKALMRAVPRFAMAPGERLTPIREVKSAILARRTEAAQARPEPKGPVLAAEELCKSFTLRAGWFSGRTRKIHAVNGVSLQLARGKTLGLVGESGCGKTTVSKMIMRALQPDSGTVTFDDGAGPRDVFALEGDDLKAYRRAVQFVFQDPFSSLNPRMTVYEILTEPLRIHEIGTSDDRFERAKQLLEMVGLDRRYLRRYPHSFSGGQRQRLGIARALALEPRVLLCDEPVSALDVSVQAQILNLLKDLQSALGLSYLFVSHNLAVVDYIADTIAVMCRGYIVEEAPKVTLFRNPVHPYTQALLAAVPDPDIDRPLDFAKLKTDRFSDPAQWPEPFRLVGGEFGAMTEIESGHRVRVTRATVREAA
jgi:peptide/nickel transport system ATP-binding protein